ncbi:unnamed protein product [Ixodes persulcatus]
MGADRSAYAFRSLGCGRRYAFYAVAFNAAGRGPNSNTVHAKTDGSTPVAPEQQDLVTANMTAATLQLSSWKSGGCPISFFVVLYKQQAAREWTPAAARVLPEMPQHQSRRQQPQQAQLPATTLVLGDLTPATWYDLLVTAHNEAGSTEAEYVFATLTLSGGTVPPPRSTQAVDSQHRHIRIIVPIVCTLLVMLLVSAVVCYVFSRRRLAAAQRPSSDDLDEPENTKAVDTVPMSVWEKPDQVASREQLYYPSPYAGSRASMYADGAPQPQETWAPTGRLRAGPLDEGDAQDDDRQADLPTQHTYDVPFLRRPPSSQTQLSSHDGLISSTELLSNHIYSKPAVVYLPPENGKSLRHQHHGSSHLPVSIIEGYPSGNVSYVYSRPKKKHWSQQDSPYAERKLHKLNSRRYSDEMKQGDMVSRESGLDFAVEAYELSEAECDMPSRHFPVQR